MPDKKRIFIDVTMVIDVNAEDDDIEIEKKVMLLVSNAINPTVNIKNIDWEEDASW